MIDEDSIPKHPRPSLGYQASPRALVAVSHHPPWLVTSGQARLVGSRLSFSAAPPPVWPTDRIRLLDRPPSRNLLPTMRASWRPWSTAPLRHHPHMPSPRPGGEMVWSQERPVGLWQARDRRAPRPPRWSTPRRRIRARSPVPPMQQGATPVGWQRGRIYQPGCDGPSCNAGVLAVRATRVARGGGHKGGSLKVAAARLFFFCCAVGAVT